ncbi:hypothetical protein [Schlesneria sp. DSM 10557]|uniref:hypothetical protein n=4 Tax=Schlesneria TaxID=656899 RepID=UPI0035A0ABCA
MSRRGAMKCGLAFMTTAAATSINTRRVSASDPPGTRGIGDVETPTFYRRDIGTSPGRMHEPTAGQDGNIWTSPLDGSLWQYHTRSGKTTIHDLHQLTGEEWSGRHLWPIAYKNKVYLCTPGLSHLTVWDRETNQVSRHPIPYENPAVYGGFVDRRSSRIYFYDTKHASVLEWEPDSETGQSFPCPYKLSGTLYMTFEEFERREIWGSTYTGNDIVRFDLDSRTWTGHFQSPEPEATPSAGSKVFGETLYCSDHLKGRILPLNVTTGEWGSPIKVPGFGKWYGYLSGGWYFRGRLYICHSTWTGGNGSLDGEPHHFIGTWTVFDPMTQGFSRLEIPTLPSEERKYLMSDYCAIFEDELFILAVNKFDPQTVIVLQTRPI